MDGKEGLRKNTSPSAAQPCLGRTVARCGCLKFGRVKRGRTKSYSQTDQVVKGTHKRNVRWLGKGGSSRMERVVRKSSARRSKPLPSWFTVRPLPKHPPLSFHHCTPLPNLTLALVTATADTITTTITTITTSTTPIQLHNHSTTTSPQLPPPQRLTRNPIWLLPVKETL